MISFALFFFESDPFQSTLIIKRELAKKRYFWVSQRVANKLLQSLQVIVQQPSAFTAGKLTALFFYGNYFYGICVVAQTIEATLQLGFPLNNLAYYMLSFVATVFYYNYPYIRKYTAESTDPRTTWYRQHYSFVRRNQFVFGIILIVALLIFLYQDYDAIFNMNSMHWLLVLIFPIISLMYYGLNFFSTKYNLRKIGWLKPFIIGFIWAGAVVVYPILFYDIIHYQAYIFSTFTGLLFLKNFMFISVLAMMFDIKDYVPDSKNHLNTFVVKIGLRKTILYILLPLPILGLLTFLSYATVHHFHLGRMILTMIPFFLLLLAGYSLHKRRTLLYYLIVIDGLMVVKAVFGIAAMLV